ncbi:UPF0481 protein At3g47200-like [Bidens hawaiensis]|uniref:UPF0481 protein At3g47200-like n=1 Tax=Bidens hawaiensis TaxID=980011 RepID=UPI004049A622
MSDLELGDLVQSLLDHVKTEHNHTNVISPSIYILSGALRDMSPSSFNPRLVSIGPLHRHDENVQAFERRKATYLINLMSRTGCPQEEILKSCMRKVYDSMVQIKACYEDHVFMKYSDAEIAKMMVMDACFILEFVLLIQEYDNESNSKLLSLYQYITLDLMLLENQIPFFILDQISQCTVSEFRPNAPLIKLICPLLSFHNLFEAHIDTTNISIGTTNHILSLLHECYKPPYNIANQFYGSRIPSAVDLDRAGVNLKPNKNPSWLMGMEVTLSRFTCFLGSWRKPTLRMPVFVVGDFTESILRNLIAYEQSGLTRSYVTSYAYVMDMLVNTQEDVAKLVDSGVLANYLDSNEEVANMINNICKELVWADFFYDEKHLETLKTYTDGYWQKNMAWLRRTYFNSPWNMIALFAGIILFALTVVQTIFTVKSA